VKLIRHLTSRGPAYAALQANGSALAIDGDIFGAWRVSDCVVTPAKTLSPVQPATIVCIGLNYAKHAAEGGKGPPERPIWFMKLPGAVQNPGDAIFLPAHQCSTRVDYEAELAIVLSKTARNIARADAFD
jgi:2-keto-4-pentenoate hydratase/2-oxohepta-3-ene-1,7-dioic acid hydratase in catechol pathway